MLSILDNFLQLIDHLLQALCLLSDNNLLPFQIDVSSLHLRPLVLKLLFLALHLRRLLLHLFLHLSRLLLLLLQFRHITLVLVKGLLQLEVLGLDALVFFSEIFSQLY